MIKTETQIVVHFGRFRNVDLTQRGLYHLRASIFQQGPDGAAVPAQPFSAFFDDQTPLSTVDGTPVHDSTVLSMPPYLSVDKCTFSTRSFLVRYNDEVRAARRQLPTERAVAP